MVTPEVGALDGGEVAVTKVVRRPPPRAERVPVAGVRVTVVWTVWSQSGVVPPPGVPGDPRHWQMDTGF